MTRETVTRHDWEIMVANLDGDVQDTLKARLESWNDGDDCDYVEYTADSAGRVDSESSPCPGDVDELLRSLAMEAFGLQFDSPEAQAILDRGDWADYWPVVDTKGFLTGDIVGDEDGYANVADMAMVNMDDLTPMGRREARLTGYAQLAVNDT